MSETSAWQKLNEQFLKDLREEGLEPAIEGQDNLAKRQPIFHGSLAGAPLKPHPIMVIGINWGGSGASDPYSYYWDMKEPDIGQLGAGRGFSDQIVKIFRSALGIENDQIKRILAQDTFWTNRSLVRTPDIKTSLKLLMAASAPSEKVLSEMIYAVKPKTILCFGNGKAHSPSDFVLGKLCEIPDWRNNGFPFPIPMGKRKTQAILYEAQKRQSRL